MSRVTAIAASLLLLISAPLAAQTVQLGVYGQPSDFSCQITDSPAEVVTVYVVMSGQILLSQVRFALPFPTCMNDPTFLSASSDLLIAIPMEPKDGVTVTFPPVCESAPITLMSLQYFSTAGSSPCCVWEVQPHPASGLIEATDCDGTVHTVSSTTQLVNTQTCFCFEIGGMAPPSNPSPPDLSVEQPLNAQLSFDPFPLTFEEIRFGTSIYPPLVYEGPTVDTYDPGPLDPNTTYYWSVETADGLEAFSTGPIWRFTTTTGVIPVTPTTWGAVKALYQ